MEGRSENIQIKSKVDLKIDWKFVKRMKLKFSLAFAFALIDWSDLFQELCLGLKGQAELDDNIKNKMETQIPIER